MTLTGKVAVITGASMGIGEAIAKLFVEQGASVVLSSRDQQRAEAARQRIVTAARVASATTGNPVPSASDRTIANACDVRSREEIERLAVDTMGRFGRLDIWVNNAGHGLSDTVVEMDMAQCRDMFDTNLFGAIEGMQVAAAIMRRQGSGSIINISSVAGYIAVPYAAAYSATKAAITAIGRGANVELRGTGVNVVTVCPGYIRTNFSQNVVRGRMPGRRRDPTQRGATAEQVARAVLRGYLRRRREVIVPAYYWAAIALYRAVPGVVESAMERSMKPL
jgi:short-subunit dehydrogenase